MPLSGEDFRRMFETFQQSAFRLQLLPEYKVEEEHADYTAFLAGEPLPDRAGHPWLEKIARHVALGRTWTKIHLLPPTLTPYLRYLIDWWYIYQERAGCQIGFLLDSQAQDIRRLASHDFWLFDDRILVHMHYDADGRLLETEDASTAETLATARAARDFALAHSQDLRTILARRRAGRRL
jgi:hypothetical protein